MIEEVYPALLFTVIFYYVARYFVDQFKTRIPEGDGDDISYLGRLAIIIGSSPFLVVFYFWGVHFKWYWVGVMLIYFPFQMYLELKYLNKNNKRLAFLSLVTLMIGLFLVFSLT
ncbi:hypothetical protein [Halalkalibacillus halophilus]|uniref:hypothetical protein n=1 Tax=Halalkalibacillus halophilus TaxID=392827 RepID=UPI0004227AB6|nr:hypothetical protein [Halalkalibacillus halophilus]